MPKFHRGKQLVKMCLSTQGYVKTRKKINKNTCLKAKKMKENKHTSIQAKKNKENENTCTQTKKMKENESTRIQAEKTEENVSIQAIINIVDEGLEGLEGLEILSREDSVVLENEIPLEEILDNEETALQNLPLHEDSNVRNGQQIEVSLSEDFITLQNVDPQKLFLTHNEHQLETMNRDKIDLMCYEKLSDDDIKDDYKQAEGEKTKENNEEPILKRVESLKTLCLKVFNHELHEYPYYKRLENCVADVNSCDDNGNMLRNGIYDSEEKVEVYLIQGELNASDEEDTEISRNNSDEERQFEIEKDLTEATGQQMYTKDGKLRKRKKHSTSMTVRRQVKQQKYRESHRVKKGCGDKCRQKCKELISKEERENINEYYWTMTFREQRMFIKQNTCVEEPKRKIKSTGKRHPKRSFYLKTSDNKLARVCKIFFLTTLGFDSKNDKVLYKILKEEEIHDDRRGKHPKTMSINRDKLNEHIKSFNPTISHYRRDHAPNKRYLPSDINIRMMYDDFLMKNPDMKISYDLYRKHVKVSNISFTRLGHEECEICEAQKIHSKTGIHDTQVVSNDCNICQDYKLHIDRAEKARNLYQKHKTIKEDNHVYYSTDLEKVIMLPRLEMFKEVIFCPRLVVFNQTFAPVGELKSEKPFAVLWHEATSGRKQEDIISTFKQFLVQKRDIEYIDLWLDNCSAQNKNWLLYFFFVHFINSNETGTKEIVLNYFEKGHTFMSCDSFHHQVELSMKRIGKLYDFKDFVDAVSAANSGKVTVIEMKTNDFFDIEDHTSSRRIQTATPRAYMRDIVQVRFTRGKKNMFYKTDFDGQYNELCFIKDTYLKPKNDPVPVFTYKTMPKGIKESRKSNIISKLRKLMPAHKMLFWENIPTTLQC